MRLVLIAVALMAAACSSSGSAGNTTVLGTVSADVAADTGADAGASAGGADVGADASGADAAVDAGAADVPPVDAGPFVEAKHQLPPAMGYGNGGVLAATRVVTVLFPNDKDAAALGEFGKQVVQGDWWAAVTAGFCTPDGVCVGKGSDGGVVTLPFEPSAAYDDTVDGSPSKMHALLDTLLDLPETPTPDGNTLYVLYIPKNVKVTLDEGPQPAVGCKQFGGYHFYTTWHDQQVPYAIVLDCGGMGVTALEQRTIASSHEIVEAATDPYPDSGFTFRQTVPKELPWLMTWGGAESADLCIDPTGGGSDRVKMGKFTVQRSWSIKAAAEGHDPCQPVPEDDLWFNVSPDSDKDDNLKIKVGETYTFAMTAWSDEPIDGGWTVSTLDLYALEMSQDSPLTVTLNGKSELNVNNGDKIEVSITLDTSSKLLKSYGTPLLFLSQRDGQEIRHAWPIRVMQTGK